MKTRYASAVDAWLAAVLVGVPLLILGVGVVAFARSPLAGAVQIGLGLLTAGLMAAFSVPCHYTLEERALTIRCGLLKETIALGRIRAAEKSRSLWSAPALSLKRVKIVLDDGRFRLVSPRERDEFITALRQHILSNERSPGGRRGGETHSGAR